MPALLTSLSTRGKITLAASALAFVAAAILLFKMASAPSYTEVMAGIDPAQTSKITGELDKAGVSYELRSNGTAIAVDSGQVGQARIALAESGVSGNVKQPGFELLDKQKLGASNFQQQVAYQRALEGQIANTIGGIQGVGGATVSLTMPKDQLFSDESQQATAAVLLQGSADTLDPGAVRGIANLVASSVQGLKTANVTITDASGALLWPQGDGTSGAGASSKVAAQARYDTQLTAQLNAMLVSTLGADKAHVTVHSDLNVDTATEEKLQYAKKGVPLKSQTETETLTGSGGGSGTGAAGTSSNIPSYAAAATSSGGRSNYKHTQTSTDLGVDKTITKRTIAPGSVNRLDVALVVDKSVPAATVTSLQAAVASAAGVQTTRGDTLAVSRVAFAKPAKVATPAGGPVPAGMMKYAKAAALGLAALLVLFFLTRQLRRKEEDPFADEPSWLRALREPTAIGPGDSIAAPPALDDFDPEAAARSIFENDPRAIALEDLVQREPEKVAQQLRGWITDDGA